MEAQSPEMQAKIAGWRQKAIHDTLTIEEMREAIKLLRSDRSTAASAAGKSKAPTRSAEDLLAELM